MSSWIGNSFKAGRNLNTALDPIFSRYNPIAKEGDTLMKKAEFGAYPKPPTPPPPPPNPNDAANAARDVTDQMRMRRGLLANITGASSQQPVSGTRTLGG